MTASDGMRLREWLHEVFSEQHAPDEKVRLVNESGITALSVVAHRRDIPLTNCFMWALGIPAEGAVAATMRAQDHTFPGSDFMGWLLPRLPVVEADIGRLVVWHHHGRVTHAGLSEGDLIVSKWGGSHLMRHPLTVVPHVYGDRVSWHERPQPTWAVEQFLQWAASRGGS